MTTYSFPSSEFPGLTGVSLDALDGWSGLHAPGAVLALVKQVEPGRFAPNITAMVTRHLPDFQVEVAVAEVDAEAVRLTDASVEPSFVTTIGAREYVGRNVAFRHAEAGTLVQVHLFTAVDNGPVRDVVHLTGTCSGERAEAEYAELQKIISSCRVDDS
jgi:hypothetical protein